MSPEVFLKREWGQIKTGNTAEQSDDNATRIKIVAWNASDLMMMVILMTD